MIRRCVFCHQVTSQILNPLRSQNSDLWLVKLKVSPVKVDGSWPGQQHLSSTTCHQKWAFQVWKDYWKEAVRSLIPILQDKDTSETFWITVWPHLFLKRLNFLSFHSQAWRLQLQNEHFSMMVQKKDVIKGATWMDGWLILTDLGDETHHSSENS